MITIWKEDEITLDNLAAHLADAGLEVASQDDVRILLHNEAGIGFSLSIDSAKKFIRFETYLPLDSAASAESKHQFADRLNADVFLPSFCTDEAGDLLVSYVMPYSQGLIVGQFMALVHRFASLLKYVVASKNVEGLITLGNDNGNNNDGIDSETSEPCPKGVLLN
jgi:hypothetical protein